MSEEIKTIIQAGMKQQGLVLLNGFLSMLEAIENSEDVDKGKRIVRNIIDSVNEDYTIDERIHLLRGEALRDPERH